MLYPSISHFLARDRALLGKGPVALIFAEDATELASTLAHHARIGFRLVVAFLPDGIELPGDHEACIVAVRHDTRADGAVVQAVNQMIGAAPGTWFYYGYNAEYLFYPFAETRTVRELLAFHAEERRDAMLTTVIDLYAGDPGAHPDGVSCAHAMLDGRGYHALARWDAAANAALDRQFDLFGGLKRRFEEHVPWDRRRIERFALFRAKKGLALQPDHRFNLDEMNTHACPWHRNATAAIASFRTAKALRRNPSSAQAVGDFRWPGSVAFDWNARQLMDLGLMEPGQWF